MPERIKKGKIDYKSIIDYAFAIEDNLHDIYNILLSKR